jgi:hypothetical protein
MAKLLFEEGNPNEFGNLKNLMPAAIFSFAVLFLPIIGAIIMMISRFSWLALILFIAYIVIAVVSGFGLKKNFCKHCKQGKIGCPAYEGMKGKKPQGDS